jgi:hypothetical protein
LGRIRLYGLISDHTVDVNQMVKGSRGFILPFPDSGVWFILFPRFRSAFWLGFHPPASFSLPPFLSPRPAFILLTWGVVDLNLTSIWH